VSGDDLENNAAAVAGGVDLQQFLRCGTRAGVRRIRRPQVRAQRGDTGLPILGPVIREPGDRARSGQLNGGLSRSWKARVCSSWALTLSSAVMDPEMRQ